jgi:MipA family protein
MTMSSRRWGDGLRFLLLICAALAPTLGWAQQTLEDQALEQQGLARAEAGWTATVGAGLEESARYPGASTDRMHPVPLVSLDYGGRLFIGPLGIGVAALRWNGFRAGPVLGFERGRNESDDPRLAGLGDIPTSITAGVFAGYAYGPLAISATARQAVSHSSNGLSGLLQVDWRCAFPGVRTLVTAGPDLEFGDGNFERAWFGVSPNQSFTSGLPVYAPRGGINRVGLHAAVTHRVSRHILLRFFARLSDITGDAAESPIVERRSQISVGAGIAYHF